LDGTVTKDSVQKGQRCLSAETHNLATPRLSQRQGIREVCRDILGKDGITCINLKWFACAYTMLSEDKCMKYKNLTDIRTAVNM